MFDRKIIIEYDNELLRKLHETEQALESLQEENAFLRNKLEERDDLIDGLEDKIKYQKRDIAIWKQAATLWECYPEYKRLVKEIEDLKLKIIALGREWAYNINYYKHQ